MNTNFPTLAEIIEFFNPIVIKADDSKNVLIKDTYSEMTFWIDVYEDVQGELTADWNQYIFHLSNAEDVLKDAVQSDADVAGLAFAAAMTYYEDNLK